MSAAAAGVLAAVHDVMLRMVMCGRQHIKPRGSEEAFRVVEQVGGVLPAHAEVVVTCFVLSAWYI